MRTLNRALTSAVAATVVTAVVGGIPAGAQAASTPNGVGSTSTTTSVLNLSLGTAGNLLKLGILTDQGRSSIDHTSGVLGASNSLVPLTIDSAAAGLHVAVPGLQTQAPGGLSDVGGTTLSLSSLGVPAAIATAEIDPAALHSDFTSTAAHSTIGAAQIKNFTLGGGALASIDLLSSNLAADALSAQADGTRGVNVGTVKLLDLGALLKGLGTSLPALPLSTVTSLIDSLGLPTGLPAGTSLAGEVTNLQTAIGGLQTTLASAGSATSLAAPLSSATSGALSSLGTLPLPLGAARTAAVSPITIPTTGTPIDQVTGLLGSLQTSLSGLLNSTVPALDSFPLVQLSATQVGITTKAADTVANSAAGISVLPLKLTVAGVPLNVDLSGTVATVNNVIGQANTALNGLLTKVGLPANLVSLDLLQQAKSVSQNGAYTLATAGITAATLKIAAVDPAAILSGITALAGGTPLSSVLTQLGIAAGTPLASVLSATNAMGALNSALGQLAPLTGGAQLQVASLSGASTYTVAPAATPVTANTPVQTSLPHTGGNPALALLGALFGLIALGGVRWARSARSLPSQN
jgi:hypothetical protein